MEQSLMIGKKKGGKALGKEAYIGRGEQRE